MCLAVVLLLAAAATAPSQATWADDPVPPDPVACSPGNPDCATYGNQNDCEPGFTNKCFNSNPACGCRWVPQYVLKCLCQNITGG